MITSNQQNLSTLNWHTNIEAGTKIIIGRGAIQELPNALSGISAGKNILILTQNDFFNDAIKHLESQLEAQGKLIHVLKLPDGEDCKSIEQLTEIWNVLHKFKFARNDSLAAVGGGSLCDVAGFAASTYLRGINLVCVPTTLLSQVDAAIGGKTAINLRHGKNLAGTFYFARAVLVDVDTLASLPQRQFRSGLAEVIKCSLLEKTIAEETQYSPAGKPLFDVLKDTTAQLAWNHPALPDIIARCINMKLAVVAKDPLESDLRRCLNLGHSLGHALETASNFTLSHGEAVTIGMVFALHIAVARKQLSKENEAAVLTLIKAAGLPVAIPPEIQLEDIVEALFHDKKREGKSIKLVLPAGELGEVGFDEAYEMKDFEPLLRHFYLQQ